MARQKKLTNVVEKPWGHEVILVKNDLYVVKQLYIKPNHRLSLQFHKEKVEHVTLVQGEAFIFMEDDRGLSEFQLIPMEPVEIPAGVVHRIMASTRSEAVLVEVSTPQLDDVIRIEDDYGRSDVKEEEDEEDETPSFLVNDNEDEDEDDDD